VVVLLDALAWKVCMCVCVREREKKKKREGGFIYELGDKR
jgi:hypothetical protein